MALHREIEGPQPDPAQPVERLAGHHELRRTGTSWHLATGTLACPACDAPVALGEEVLAPSAVLGCPYCAHTGALREFLSLAAPTRPARVAVSLRLPRGSRR